MTLPLLLAALLQPPLPAPAPDTLVARIYAVVLDTSQLRADTRILLVNGRTVTGVGHADDFDYANGLRGLAPLPEGLQEDFEAKRRAGSVVPPIPTRVPTMLLTDSLAATLPRPMSREFWEELQRRWPDHFPGLRGMIGLSPVGFSHDRRSAMVMVDHPGGTVYYLLGRRDGRWVVVRRAEVRTV